MSARATKSDDRVRRVLHGSRGRYPSALPARLLGSLALLLLLLSFAHTSAAEGLRIRVRGSTKIAARASRDQGELVLSGSLADDAGQPLVNQTLTIRVRREIDPHDVRVAEALRKSRVCDRPSGPPQRAYDVRAQGPLDAPDVVVVTDDDGRFCFRAKLDPDRFKALLLWRPPASGTGSLLDPVDREIAFDLSRVTLALKLDPAPRIVHLDPDRTTFEAVAYVDDETTPRVAPGLDLALSNETSVPIARAITDASGRARFVVETNRLGAPGPGELRVSFAGDGETSQAVLVEEIERHVKVTLRLPAAERGELVPKVPEDGIPIVVDVGSASGPVGEGAIEARIGEVLVGVAPVERGVARPTLTFVGQGNDALVRLRYVPSSPWFEAGDEHAVRIPIRGPGLLAKAPILVAGLCVLAFFLAGRFSSRRAQPVPKGEKARDEEAEAEPRIDVVRPAARGEAGWRGRVVDAHEGTPVRGARVWIERGTFEGRTLLASVACAEDGTFEIAAPPSIARDEQISAEAPLHSRLSQSLPEPGELSIALAARRRALLARLVTWAKRRGPPFDVRPEPTPGQVRRAGAANEEVETVRWAEAVEHAVFGRDVVDARTEKEIETLEPRREDAPARRPGGPPRR